MSSKAKPQSRAKSAKSCAADDALVGEERRASSTKAARTSSRAMTLASGSGNCFAAARMAASGQRRETKLSAANMGYGRYWERRANFVSARFEAIIPSSAPS
jgi:hypothetical protein